MQSSEALSFGVCPEDCTLLLQPDFPFGFAMGKAIVLHNTCIPFIQLFWPGDEDHLLLDPVFKPVRKSQGIQDGSDGLIGKTAGKAECLQ